VAFTIMLTSAGGEMIPFLITQLKASPNHAPRVLAIDAGDGNISRYLADGFWTIPHGKDPGYADAVLAILRQTKVDLLVPCSDEEALSLSARREDVADAGCTLACVDHATLDVFSDKTRCYEVLAEKGIPVPLWRKVENLQALVSAVGEVMALAGACVVKPATGRGGRDVFVIGNTEGTASLPDEYNGRETHLSEMAFKELCAGQTEFAFPLIAMERLSEPVFDIDMLAWQGEPVHVVPRRRANSQLPNEGHIFVDAPELQELGTNLVRAFSLSWLYDCDIMYDQAGHPRILEINPRPSGSAAVTVAAGVPLFENMIALAKGDTTSAAPPVAGHTVLPYKTLLRV